MCFHHWSIYCVFNIKPLYFCLNRSLYDVGFFYSFFLTIMTAVQTQNSCSVSWQLSPPYTSPSLHAFLYREMWGGTMWHMPVGLLSVMRKTGWCPCLIEWMKAQCSTKQFPASVITHVYQIIFKVPPAGAGLQLLGALLQCIIIIIIMGCSAEVLGTLDVVSERTQILQHDAIQRHKEQEPCSRCIWGVAKELGQLLWDAWNGLSAEKLEKLKVFLFLLFQSWPRQKCITALYISLLNKNYYLWECLVPKTCAQ